MSGHCALAAMGSRHCLKFEAGRPDRRTPANTPVQQRPPSQMLISLTEKKDIHTYQHTTSVEIFLLSSVMSYDDSLHWHGRAKEMLARAEQMNECVTKQVLRRVADAYEGLAQKAEKQAKRFPPNPVSKTSLPAKARQLAPRDRLVAHVKQMDECATELVLRQVADACECLARTAEQRAKQFPPKPVSNTSMALVDARQFARRKDRLGAPAARAPSIEIPSFLKQGPKAEETSAAGTTHIWLQQLFGYMSQLPWRGTSLTKSRSLASISSRLPLSLLKLSRVYRRSSIHG
jgi:hypothetical protein